MGILRTSVKILRNSSNHVLRSGILPPQEIKYGRLYNWWAASKNGGSGIGSIAPLGYHLPSKTEYDALITYLGGTAIAGGKLKEAGVGHWQTPNASATNSTGFTALPGGSRGANGIFINNINQFGFWWQLYATPMFIYLYYNFGSAYNNNDDTGKSGYSIRLLKDDSTFTVGDTLTDYEGNIYPLTKIGTQVWTVKNWKCIYLNDGTPIPKIIDNTAWGAMTDIAYSDYNNDPAYT